MKQALAKMKVDTQQQHSDLQRQIKLISKLVEVATTEQNESLRGKLDKLNTQLDEAANNEAAEQQQSAVLRENVQQLLQHLQSEPTQAENEQQDKILQHLQTIEQQLKQMPNDSNNQTHEALRKDLSEHFKNMKQRLDTVTSADKSVLKQLATLEQQLKTQRDNNDQQNNNQQLARAEQVIQIKDKLIAQLNEQLTVKNRNLLRKDEVLTKLRAHLEKSRHQN